MLIPKPDGTRTVLVPIGVTTVTLDLLRAVALASRDIVLLESDTPKEEKDMHEKEVFVIRNFRDDKPEAPSNMRPLPRAPHTYRGGFPPSHDSRGRPIKR